MSRIFLRSAIVTLTSVAFSLLIALTVAPGLGVPVSRTTWLICAALPMALAWPVSAYAIRRAERLERAHRHLARIHARLVAAHNRLAVKASRDDMTGMLNRENFVAALERSHRQSERGVLLIIDADHFKAINDNFGHLAGDKALTLIAAAIRRGLRDGDIAGRIGGEEFGAFLVDATEKEGQRVADRIRNEVELILFRPVGEWPVLLTVSIGGTACAPGTEVSELMRVADRKLYEAKHRGRNLTIIGAGISAAA
jgi:diguanylate cyclase (GGDEF)-like protein